jgi:hypothetical protein|uniref:Uncharacterized protein n=1 Tax=Eutreptiella gymnastica TaxID=73025 RepID=A0A7S4CXQ1_9EUGL|mmetsp:Transcript_91508/g.153321  ORF Transcript_91508/g.153321 Transcript_91508/m.153321 type:complete len:127 (+) Transcript_91508:245-625(+)
MLPRKQQHLPMNLKFHTKTIARLSTNTMYGRKILLYLICAAAAAGMNTVCLQLTTSHNNETGLAITCNAGIARHVCPKNTAVSKDRKACLCLPSGVTRRNLMTTLQTCAASESGGEPKHTLITDAV